MEAVLGRGAMGVIYRAHDPAIGRTVAIKLIRADLLEGEEREEFLARFRQEAQAAGRCMHPNIVTIHDFALHDGNPFLAMEYVEGESLAAALRRVARFAPDRAVAVLAQMLDALGAAHALGIVHRDVKPANILLLPDGRVKMTDFGIARLDGGNMTLAGAVLGTPSYMSPEQCRGELVDARSDLFSAGVVLFELLSGERPFPGRTFTEIAHALTDPAPMDPGPRLAGQTPTLIAIVRRALAKRPQDRFASAEMMAAALRTVPSAAAGEAPEPGATVIAVPATRAFAPTERGILDPAILATIERRLAGHVGPIARHLVREAAREAGSLDALATRLGHNIARPADREAFLTSVRRDSSAARPRPGPDPETPGLPPAVLEGIQRDLARAVGPIARLLVSRAAIQGGTETELRRRLAADIADPVERSAFLGGDG
ncbi:MAG: serine/threonine-protein kinase [Acetobacteraceae bacterium]